MGLNLHSYTAKRKDVELHKLLVNMTTLIHLYTDRKSDGMYQTNSIQCTHITAATQLNCCRIILSCCPQIVYAS